MLICPKCESSNIGQYRHTSGPIWCSSCGFRVEEKEKNNPFIIKDVYGYKQKGNRYFVSYGFGKTATPDFVYGFKSKKQFNEWMRNINNINLTLNWRAGYVWTFRGIAAEYRLCDRKGNLVQN